MNIFLIGYRCTGKTSVGKLLAEKLERSFVDADSRLVEEYGMAIKDMVAAQGWDAFREKERIILKGICALDRQVVATGGGVILNNNNVTDMKNSGIVVWLRATPETIKKRIVQDEKTEDQRPALTAKGLIEEIEETLLNRNPLYENAMNFVVDTDVLSIDEICDIVVKKMNIDFK
jgi:shikimate kinase